MCHVESRFPRIRAGSCRAIGMEIENRVLIWIYSRPIWQARTIGIPGLGEVDPIALCDTRDLQILSRGRDWRAETSYAQSAKYEADLATVRSSRLQELSHASLNIRETVEVGGRTVCGKGAGREPGRLGLAKVVVCFRYQRGYIFRSVGIVCRFCLRAPLTEAREELFLGGRLDSVAGCFGAVASEHDRNTRLMVRFVRGFRCFGDKLAIEDWSRLVRRGGSPCTGGPTVKNLLGTEGAEFGQRGLILSLDPHRMREPESDRLGRHRIVRIDVVFAHRPRSEHAVARTARLDDGFMKQASPHRRSEEAMHGDAACRKAKDSDVVRVASKRRDVAFDPLEGSDLIHVRIVALQLVGTLAAQRREGKETEAAYAVIGGDQH